MPGGCARRVCQDGVPGGCARRMCQGGVARRVCQGRGSARVVVVLTGVLKAARRRPRGSIYKQRQCTGSRRLSTLGSNR